MKSVTEFPNFTLTQAIKAKATLSAEGKSPEEIQTSLGETFKMEGDKLKHFISAIDVAGQNPENLKRVVVLSLNEGETAPAKSTKVEEFHFVPEYYQDPKARAAAADAKDGGRGGRGGRGGGRGGPGGKGGGGPKSSPWGLSPEEKAAKGPKKPTA